MQRAVQNLLSRVGRAPAFRPPQSRTFSGVPGKEQMNAAAARAGEEVQNLGNAIGENVQKLQWWTSAKRRGAAAQEFAHFMGQVVNLPQLPVGVALAGGLAVFEVYAWFVVGEIIGKRQLIGYPVKAASVHH